MFTITPTDPESAPALACLTAYFGVLQAKIPGLPPGLLSVPDPGAASYRPPQGQSLIAWRGDQALGCVSLRRLDPATAEVKRLWVAPQARGQGLARRLMQAIEDQARALGYAHLKLDTNAALPEAIALYRATGWADAAPYSPFPSTHWFAKTL